MPVLSLVHKRAIDGTHEKLKICSLFCDTFSTFQPRKKGRNNCKQIQEGIDENEEPDGTESIYLSYLIDM